MIRARDAKHTGERKSLTQWRKIKESANLDNDQNLKHSKEKQKQ